jgi:NDP-sugar pyrophosphorylase family protein
MMLVVPMAGRGSRFAEAVPDRPKPLIEVAGEPMVFRALRSVEGIEFSRIIFILLEEHERRFRFTELAHSRYGSNAMAVLLPDVTEGQLCTVLAAKELINGEEDVLISSSDTFVVSNLGEDIRNKRADCRGIISVANLPGDRWSFARTADDGRVVEVAEKVRISDYASTGLYYFVHGRDLVEVGEEMIRNGEKTRGEYYVIPVYQKFIQRGWRVDISLASEMWDMGTPDAMREFVARGPYPGPPLGGEGGVVLGGE